MKNKFTAKTHTIVNDIIFAVYYCSKNVPVDGVDWNINMIRS